MSQKFDALIPGIVLLAATIFPMSLANAQAVSLQEQLSAQYKLVKMGSDSNGAAVVEAGTILNIKKGGILGVPYSDQSVLSTKYESGTVHSPNPVASKVVGWGLGKLGKTQTTQFFQVGNKVYPSKVIVNLPKDQVVISIVDCDSCNNVSPTTFFKADVIFQFAKGSLATAAAPQVEDTIGGLLAIDDSGGDQGGNNGQQGGNDQQGNNQQGGDQGAAQGQAQQQAPPPEPQQIEKNQTPDQVKAALGNPDKIVNLGSKQIYVYKDLKVTFINGKVSDVQ
ncbi:MAG TPA: hypothetical protein VK302_19195 [Terriglobales bacterium]|nr:hypothetical protein [Terriglobales bacterium]